MSDGPDERAEIATETAPAIEAIATPAAAASTNGSHPEGHSSIRVNVPAFDGPLDLLLHLIQQNEIDIRDIPIAKITRQYLETLELMRELDLEVAGEFLVMAATLMRIKARMLLPPAVTEEEEEDPRETLVRQLLEYSRFKEAAHGLMKLETERRLHWERGAPAQLEDPESRELLPVSMFRLLDALKGVLSRQVPAIVHTVHAEPISLEEAIGLMRTQLGAKPKLLFEELLEAFVTRIEKITAFLGLLELLKQGTIHATQESLFGPIWIEWQGDQPLLEETRQLEEPGHEPRHDEITQTEFAGEEVDT
ncbi:MAG TPA: segregation/condensation protein A [Candidatus Eisenbacteria bacterium]|nr:segregation/condensation protein A [Candidatus Eisenbacteria bacterium]